MNFSRPTGKTPTSFKLTLLDQSNNSGRPQTSPSQFDSASIPSSLPSTPLRKVLDRRRTQPQSLQRWTLRPLPVLLEPASSEPTTSLTNVYPPKSTTSVTGKSAGEAVQSDLSCGLKTCAFGEILDLITGNCILEPVSPRTVPGQRLILPPHKCLSLNSYFICNSCEPKHQISEGSCVPCISSPSRFPLPDLPRHFINTQGHCQLVNP